MDFITGGMFMVSVSTATGKAIKEWMLSLKKEDFDTFDIIEEENSLKVVLDGRSFEINDS
ncbi:hypothetical protein [Streptomyces hebeiensis]